MASFFYNTIYQLRTTEEMVLYDRVLTFSDEDDELIMEFLEIEFNFEKENYPFLAPSYNAKCALWATKFLYNACQLIIHREAKEVELDLFFPEFEGEMDASAILSADLCLRFLPMVLLEAKKVDVEDVLISIVEKIFYKWHYSSIGYKMDNKIYDFTFIIKDNCLFQLYADRVILKNDLITATESVIKNKIKETLGNYPNVFWTEFEKIN